MHLFFRDGELAQVELDVSHGVRHLRIAGLELFQRRQRPVGVLVKLHLLLLDPKVKKQAGMVGRNFLSAQQSAQSFVRLSLGTRLQRQMLAGGNLTFLRLGIGRIGLKNSFEGIARRVEVASLQQLGAFSLRGIRWRGLGC